MHGAMLLMLPLLAMAEPVSVRVRQTRGGPQIHVDGKPVPPRFFFGSMNRGTIAASPEWARHEFEFTPGAVDGTGTLHFRFAHSRGEVWLSDLRLRDARTREDVLPPGSFDSAAGFAKSWNYWPSGPTNTVGTVTPGEGSVHVALREPPDGKWPGFHLHSNATLRFEAGRRYRCTFRARATPRMELPVSLYSVVRGTWRYIGGPPGSFMSQIALARDVGVDLVSFSAPNCWNPPEDPVDWEPFDDLCRRIISVNPKVLLVPRVGADAPRWWLERHPDARMVYDDGTSIDYACVSDRTYRADACAHLEKVCRHLMRAFPRNFAGIHPCGQNTGEWFYKNTWARPLSGYDPVTRAEFRRWLARRGVPDAADAEPPAADERRAHPRGLLRDPAREGRLIEFARFLQREMADHIAGMASACRRATGGTKLVVFFYGYLFEFPPVESGAPTSGHYALTSLLGSPDIDVLCSPIAYSDREWIGTAPSMTAAESVMRSGILWLNEDDSRTFLDRRTEAHVQEGGLVDLKQTRQVMRRNTAQAAIRGFGTWWMDLPAQGWFDDARIWEEMSLLRAVDAAMVTRRMRFTPQIAAIVDEDSMCHLAGGSRAFVTDLVTLGRAAFGRSGAPYGQYVLDDVLAGAVTSKLQVFLAAWALTPAQRATLARRRAPGTVRAWCYAPGYVFPDRVDVAGIESVTGFAARAVDVPTAEATPTRAGRKLGLSARWGQRHEIRPLFSVRASPEETLAVYADGSPAVAVRRSREGTDVFVGVPQLTPELVRALARMAGVHIFTEGNATVWAAEGYVSLQAHETGPLVLDTGRRGPVTDALDGRAVGTGPMVTLSLEKGEVRVLKY